LSAPIEKDPPFGIVNVYYRTNCIASAPLYALNKVPAMQNSLIADRVQEPRNGISVWIILGIFVVAFVVVLILLRNSKIIRRIVGRKRHRKRRT
jgi:hypothetical protein